MKVSSNHSGSFSIFVLVFLCLGAFLRIYNFWLPALWTDEYGTWWTVAGPTWLDVVYRVVSVASTSPFYYLLVWIFSEVLGAGAVSIRLPSLLFGIGAVGLAYPLARQIFCDRHAALVALAAFAVNETMIFYSQEGRPYALAIFLTMLSFVIYLSLLQTERLWVRIAYVLTCAAIFYAHFLFAFVVIIQVFYLCIRFGYSWVRSPRWQITFIAMALITLPGAAQAVGVFQGRKALDWVSDVIAFRWDLPLKAVLQFLEPWIFSITAFVVLAIGYGSLKRDEGTDSPHCALLLVWFLLPIATFYSIPPLFGVMLFHPRYLLLAEVAAPFIIGWLLAAVNRKGFRKWIPLIVFLFLTIAWKLYPNLEKYDVFAAGKPRQGWSEAVRFLEGFSTDEDLILVNTGFVEADLVVEGTLSPIRLSALEWPVRANLSSPIDKLELLPYRMNSTTRSYIDGLLDQSARHPRVWLLSGHFPELFGYVRDRLRDRGFRMLQSKDYGTVRLVVFERETR